MSDTTELSRIPGLFRRWELGQILDAGREYLIEEAGETRDGSRLLAVYARGAVAKPAKGLVQ